MLAFIPIAPVSSASDDGEQFVIEMENATLTLNRSDLEPTMMGAKTLEAQIKDIANLQAEIAALRARQQAVEDLQADRNLPVHLLDEMVKQLPDGVYLSTLKQ